MLSGVHREVVVAFMVITSQHPIVSGLSGRSDLGAEVVGFLHPGRQDLLSYPVEQGGPATLPCLVFIEFREQVKVSLNGFPCQEKEHLDKLMYLPEGHTAAPHVLLSF